VRAYVDESLRLTGAGWYVLAAVVVPGARADDVRTALRAGPPGGRRRYHWHDEDARSREAMAARIGALRLDAVVVVTTPVTPRRSERARRHCLLRLLWELEQRGVGDVLLESRRERDVTDREVIGHGHRSGHVSAALRHEFGRPKDEPLLWLADVVAGAVARAVAEDDPTYLDLLDERIVVLAVP
jgi:hypothetical protein